MREVFLGSFLLAEKNGQLFLLGRLDGGIAIQVFCTVI